MARSATQVTPLVLLLATACTPQNATLTSGEYLAFLSETTSFSLEAEKVAPEDWEETWNVDCRLFENNNEEEALELSDPLAICNPKSDGRQIADVVYEQWLNQSPWHVVREDLAPWAGEAVITGEDDFQVTFHHRLPGGEDFRFAFVVDPDFQPTTCSLDGEGTPDPIPLDGDWLGEWSKDLDEDYLRDENGDLKSEYAILADFVDDPDAKLYYLNSRGYQFNPGDGDEVWVLPQEWRAGFGAGKFSEEEFHTRAPRWGDPALYDYYDLFELQPEFDPSDLFFCDPLDVSDDVTEAEVEEDFLACMNDTYLEVQDIASTMAAELALAGVSVENPEPGEKVKGAEPIMAPMVHNNDWRAPDGYPPGLDGWVDLHYNYVVLSGNVEPGGTVKGAFSLVFDSDESASRFLVQGTFEVPKVKKDKWVTANLSEEKHEENDTVRCN